MPLLPRSEQADAEHVDEDAVERRRGASFSSSSAWSALIVRLDAPSLMKSGVPVASAACTIALRRLVASRDDDAREAEREEAARGLAARVGRERVEVRELGLAEDLHARRDDAVEVAGEREAALLDARMANRPAEPARRRRGASSSTLETRVGDELPDGDARPSAAGSIGPRAHGAALVRPRHGAPFFSVSPRR